MLVALDALGIVTYVALGVAILLVATSRKSGDD